LKDNPVIEIESNNTQGAKICVIGIGGGGGNAINNMITKGLTGVDFIAANTDLQALNKNLSPIKIQIGKASTRGLGAGADPSVGHKAVEESSEEMRQVLTGVDMVFVTAGMGGGTGTGAAPVVAKIARDLGALVVGIVTKPFKWEGGKRSQVAERGAEELRRNVDALIVIPNQRLLAVIDKHTSFKDAYLKVDDVLYNATRGIADIISGTGYVNVDFADVRTVMKNTGDALMGTGFAKGEHRAVEAAQNAISSPLLDGVSIKGAQGVLVNVTAGAELTMYEVNEAVSTIHQIAGDDANLIHGVVFDEGMGDMLMVTLVATGFASDVSERISVLEMPADEQHGEHANASSSPLPTIPHEPQQMPLHHGVGVPKQSPNGTTTTTTTTAMPRTVPTRSPSGVQELQKYDAPAYERRGNTAAGAVSNSAHNNSNGNGEFGNGVKVSRTEEAGSNTEQSSESVSRSAFLRRVME
jgi:cell division protein FtsZ